MIDINFFEKKKVNILPYIVGGGFLFLLLIMGIYFFFTRMYLGQTIEDKNEWLTTHAEDVVLSRQISQIDQTINQSTEVQETLREIQYPMNQVTEDIVTFIPDEINRVLSFQLAEPNQITLILENTQATMAQTIVEDFETLPYVTGVQFLHAETQSSEDNQLRYELMIDLNEELIAEEETE